MSRLAQGGASDPFATIGFALKQAQHALRTHMDAALLQIGLTTPQYAVLALLETVPGASNAILARRAFVTAQTMQATLVGLERAGFVRRKPHPEHGRVQTTELTADGRKALAAAGDIVADIESRLGAAVAPTEPGAVIETLRRLASALR